MEKTEPLNDLAESRAQLSRMLLRTPRRNIDGVVDDSFPRSKVMRFLLEPKRRGLWIAGATTAAVLFPALSHAGKLGALAAVAGRLTKTFYRARK